MAYRSAFTPKFIEDRAEKGVGKLGCWIWTRSLMRDGYGLLGPGAPERLAHRLSYHLFVGPIPKGMTVDHICYEPSCVNPEHLRLLTVSENSKRQRMHPRIAATTRTYRKSRAA